MAEKRKRGGAKGRAAAAPAAPVAAAPAANAPDAPPAVIRIGTRGSELALRQARMVERALTERGYATELVTFTTLGDLRLDQPLHGIGGKGLFTQELEDRLQDGHLDCAVHSLKDLPTDPPYGIEVCAELPREDPRDVLVVRPGVAATSLRDLPEGARVGTSSLRRRAQLLALRPDLDVTDLRGNVPTRLRKVDEGRVDAAILAAAGLIRLDLRERITAYLDPPEWLPAAGQGVVAVQIRSADDRMRHLAEALHHRPTAIATRAERTFLDALNGGCQVPIGALAAPGADGRLTLHGLVADLEGKTVLRGSRLIDPSDPTVGAMELANELLAQGGTEILQFLRQLAKVPAPQPE